MRPARLLSEVWRNNASRPLMSLITVAAAVAVGLVSTTWAISTTTRIQESRELQILRGGFTVRVVETLGGTLNAARCDDLSKRIGVQAAGGLLDEEIVALHGQPSGRVYVQRVTPGYLALAFPAEPGVAGAGVVVGPDLAARLDIKDGQLLPLARPAATKPAWLKVEQVVGTEARISGASSSVLITTTASGDLSECLVAIEPRYVGSVVSLLPGWFDNDSVVVSPFLPVDDTQTDPESDLAERPTKFVGIGAGMLLVLVATSTWLLRRSELALYVILGISRRRLLLMASAEVMILLAAPFCAGVAVMLLARGQSIGPALLATFPSDIALAAPILALLPWLCLLVVSAEQPVRLLREA